MYGISNHGTSYPGCWNSCNQTFARKSSYVTLGSTLQVNTIWLLLCLSIDIVILPNCKYIGTLGFYLSWGTPSVDDIFLFNALDRKQ